MLNLLPQGHSTDVLNPKPHSARPQWYHAGSRRAMKMPGTGIPVPGGFPENPSSISNLVSAWVWLGTQVVTSEKESAAGQHRSWAICLPRNRRLSWTRACWGSYLPSTLHPCQSLLLTSWGLTGAIATSAPSSHLPRCRASFGDVYDVSVMGLSIFRIFSAVVPVCQAFPLPQTRLPSSCCSHQNSH